MQGVVTFLITSLLKIYEGILKKISKSVKIWRNYGHEFVALLFGPPCEHDSFVNSYSHLLILAKDYFYHMGPGLVLSHCKRDAEGSYTSPVFIVREHGPWTWVWNRATKDF